MKFTMALWFSYELIRYLDIIGEKKKWNLGCGKILIQSAVGSNKANGNKI